MISLRVLILLCTLAYTSCTQHFNINKQMDEILPEFNRYLRSKQMVAATLPDFGYPASPVFIGVTIRNLTTIYRTGDCELWGDGDNLKIKMMVGLKDMSVNVFVVPYMMQNSATFEFQGAAAEIGITLIPESKNICRTSWDYIEIKTLGDIIGHTSYKKYDGQPLPDEIKKDLILYYNKYLNNDEMFSIKLLNNLINLCNQNPVISTYKHFRKL
uniref:Heteropteran venom family 5 protein 1 n=1 Tax=Ectomocoris sp. TaxID=3104572 RepID=A0AB38ZE64_9HEMI